MLSSFKSPPTAASRLLRLLAASSMAAALFLGITPEASAQESPQPIGARYVRSAPFRYAGRLTFDSGGVRYIGSGTVVTYYGVLTAAHNLYDRNGGFSTSVLFERAKYGASSLSQATPSTLYVLSGYTDYANYYGSDSSAAFSRDLGGLRFSNAVAYGSYAGWTSSSKRITSDSLKTAIGYGAEWHSGAKMLFAQTNHRSNRVRDGYYDNNGFIVEGGQSGGPVFVRGRVAAVLVSGSSVDAGIRAVDATAAAFIRTNL